MTLADQATFDDWQQHKHAPPAVRLEEDYDAMLDVLGLALNAPEGLQGDAR